MPHDFTLIVPTYNRYNFLLRLLRFYQSYGFPFSIAIVDSSSNSLDRKELRGLLACEKITYSKVDPGFMLEAKIAHCLRNVTTTFAAVCGDDDFIIPSAVDECVRFLGENPGYSCVQGLFIHHSFTSGPEGGFSWNPLYPSAISNEGHSPSERLKGYLATGGRLGGQFFNAVYQSKLLRQIFEEAVSYVPGNYWNEIFPGSLSLIYGKRKILPIFYCSREPHKSRHFDEEYRKSCYSQPKVEQAVQCIAGHLRKMEGVELKDAELAVRQNLNTYIDRELRSPKTGLSPSFLSEVISDVFRLRNRIFVRLYKIYYSTLIERKTSRSYRDYSRVRDVVMAAGVAGSEADNARSTYPR